MSKPEKSLYRSLGTGHNRKVLGSAVEWHSHWANIWKFQPSSINLLAGNIRLLNCSSGERSVSQGWGDCRGQRSSETVKCFWLYFLFKKFVQQHCRICSYIYPPEIDGSTDLSPYRTSYYSIMLSRNFHQTSACLREELSTNQSLK